MLNNEVSNTGRNRLLMTAVVLYLILASGCAILTTFHQTGLAGEIVDLQYAVIGWASVKITIIVTIAIYCLPLTPVFMGFKRFAPASARSFRGYVGSLNRFPNPMTWGFVLGPPAVMLLVGCLICAVLLILHKHDEHLPVYQVQLDHALTEPDTRSGYIELTGNSVPRYMNMYQEGSSLQVFVPVVEQGWRPAAPVRYVVHYEATAPSEGLPDLPFAFTNKVPSLFTGKLTQRLPVPIARNFAARGLKVPPGLTVVEWQDLPNHHPAVSFLDVYFAAGISVLLAGMTLVMLCSAKVANARVLAKR